MSYGNQSNLLNSDDFASPSMDEAATKNELRSVKKHLVSGWL